MNIKNEYKSRKQSCNKVHLVAVQTLLIITHVFHEDVEFTQLSRIISGQNYQDSLGSLKLRPKLNASFKVNCDVITEQSNIADETK